VIYELKSSANGLLDQQQLTRLRAIQGGDIKRVWTKVQWKQGTNQLVENKRYLRQLDVLDQIGLKRIGLAVTTASALVAFANADTAYAELETEIKKLPLERDRMGLFLQQGVVMEKTKNLIDAMSGGIAGDAANVAFLGFIYGEMLPKLAEPHWQD
jgi:hypothetical protein